MRNITTEVIYYVAVSLDSYIATQDGGIAWLAPFEGSGEDYGYTAFYNSVDAVLVGSHTYEQALTFSDWPWQGKPCWVFSQRQRDVIRPEVTLTPKAPLEVMSELSARGLKRAWLVGGGALAGAFRAQGLITEYIVSLLPIILGAGVPLFGSSGPMETLQLTEAKAYPNGLMQLRYVQTR